MRAEITPRWVIFPLLRAAKCRALRAAHGTPYAPYSARNPHAAAVERPRRNPTAGWRTLATNTRHAANTAHAAPQHAANGRQRLGMRRTAARFFSSTMRA